MSDKNKREHNNSYSHILKYTGLFGGVQGLSIAIGIIRNKLVAMLLGPNGMGLVSLFSSATKLISDSTSFGIPISGVKTLSHDFDEGNEEKVVDTIKIIRSLSLLVALFGIMVCIIASPFLSDNTFSWKGGHLWHYILLSPVVGFTAITGGEIAILKATRRLKALAVSSLLAVIAALLISVPIYYVWGMSGIVPVLVLIAFAQMLLTVFYSYHYYPLHISIKRHIVSDGYDMLRLGIAFVLAGIFGSGAEFLIRTYLNTTANVSQVGLYNAGFMMTMVYVGVVFSSLESDYFPRLSGIPAVGEELNRTVNRQIEVMLLLVSPLLVFYIVFLPYLLPLLYTGKFLSALDMSRLMVIAMYFRALTLPVEYIPLSRGDSKTYLITEVQYDILIVVLVILGYNWYGLMGTGIAVSMTGLFNLLFVYTYAYIKYGYRTSGNVISYALLQIPIGVLALGASLITNTLVYWLAALLLLLISSVSSLIILRSKSRLWESMKNKFTRKNHV